MHEFHDSLKFSGGIELTVQFAKVFIPDAKISSDRRAKRKR
jgi:hypothetical protein